MKPVVTRFYAVLVVLALVGLIAWSGADWYQLRQRAEGQAQSVLRQAAGLVADRSLKAVSPADVPLGPIFARYPGSDPRWKALVLWTVEGNTEYYRGPRPPVPADQAVPRWEARPLTEIRVTLPVFRADGAPRTLEGIYEFYGGAEVFVLLKSCSITLVVLLVLTTILVFLLARREPSPTEDEAPVDEAVSDFSDAEALADLPPLGALEPEAEEEYWFDDDLAIEDLPPLDPPTDDPLEAPEPVSPAVSPDAEGPSLFSPRSGLGWENFLGTRLAFELERSTSQNQDLAVVFLALKEASVDPVLWGEAVRGAFPSVDLDFEYQEGAAVILPGRTLDQALKAARTFVDLADKSLGGLVVHAGVSARAGRLVSSETLLAEAESARRRSLAGTVRVLGLKTDPDRYREHLASTAASA